MELNKTLNALTARCTAFKTFNELLCAEGGYFPSLQCKTRNAGRARIRDNALLADFYDEAQQSVGSVKRAHRW